jgi:hypothetical protein
METIECDSVYSFAMMMLLCTAIFIVHQLGGRLVEGWTSCQEYDQTSVLEFVLRMFMLMDI